jgi:hypothetical protein
MTRTIRAVTAPAIGSYTLTDIEYVAPGSELIGVSPDNTKIYGCTGNILQVSTNAFTIGATPIWTTVHDFTAEGGTTRPVRGMHFMSNGEVLVTTANGANFSVVYVSSGWAANPATATWAQALQATNGAIQNNYSMTQWQSGTNGVVFLVDSAGAQTLGGVGNDATDATRGGFCWLSTDFGKNFTKVFDIREWCASRGVPYPAGVHLHGGCYDQFDDRLYLCPGDNTGDMRNAVGLGFIQVLYSDDRGATWNLLPSPSKWVSTVVSAANSMQFISVAPLENCIVLSPDVTSPGSPITYHRKGFRNFGVMHTGVSSGSGGGVSGHTSRSAVGQPTFVGGINTSTQTVAATAYIPVLHPNQDVWSKIACPVPVQSPANTGFGFLRIYGPFANGRIIATSKHTIGGAANTLMRATLVAPAI